MTQYKMPETLEGAHKLIKSLMDNLVADHERMLQANKKVRINSEASTQLMDAVASIEDVLMAIKKISSQTKLLSINASIEAAQAGEAGRGFAVVADEVKGLSVQTTEATKAIADNIEMVSKNTKALGEANQAIHQEIEAAVDSNKAIFEDLQVDAQEE